MAIATGARSKVGFITEVTYGTTPLTPNLAELPFTSFSVNLTRDEHDDNSLRADRMERYSLSGNRAVAGQIDVNFAHGLYNTLLESALQGAFTTKILKTGVTRKSVTLEEGSLDISTPANSVSGELAFGIHPKPRMRMSEPVRKDTILRHAIQHAVRSDDRGVYRSGKDQRAHQHHESVKKES